MNFLRQLAHTHTFKPDTIDHGSLKGRTTLPLRLGHSFGLNLDAAFADRASKLCILFLHGNRYNITKFERHYALFDTLGISWLTFDYPGYGNSGGTPTEAGLYASARCAYSYLVSDRGYHPDQIVVYGLSLGAAVAAELLTHAPARCFISEAAFVNTRAMARLLYPTLPLHLLVPNQFRNDLTFPRLRQPTCIVHGDCDPVTPVEHARKLHALMRVPCILRIISGAEHNDCLDLGGAMLRDELRRFIDTRSVDGG